MTKKQEKQLRETLLAKLEELGGKARRGDLIAERQNDPMDELQSRMDLDLTVRFVNTDFQTKRAIERALRALDEGEYGVCLECGDEINAKRLQAIPWTTVCVACQEQLDEAEEYRKAA